MAIPLNSQLITVRCKECNITVSIEEIPDHECDVNVLVENVNKDSTLDKESINTECIDTNKEVNIQSNINTNDINDTQNNNTNTIIENNLNEINNTEEENQCNRDSNIPLNTEDCRVTIVRESSQIDINPQLKTRVNTICIDSKNRQSKLNSIVQDISIKVEESTSFGDLDFKPLGEEGSSLGDLTLMLKNWEIKQDLPASPLVEQIKEETVKLDQLKLNNTINLESFEFTIDHSSPLMAHFADKFGVDFGPKDNQLNKFEIAPPTDPKTGLGLLDLNLDVGGGMKIELFSPNHNEVKELVKKDLNSNDLKCGICNMGGDLKQNELGLIHLTCLKCKLCNVVHNFLTPIQIFNQKPFCSTCLLKVKEGECQQCNAKILDEMILSNGSIYCKQHITCFQCQKLYNGEEQFFEHGNQIYCKQDFIQLYSIQCQCCQQAIYKDLIKVDELNFHLNCFKCRICDLSLLEECFLFNDLPYCENHFNQLASKNCNECNMDILDIPVHKNGLSYHVHCAE